MIAAHRSNTGLVMRTGGLVVRRRRDISQKEMTSTETARDNQMPGSWKSVLYPQYRMPASAARQAIVMSGCGVGIGVRPDRRSVRAMMDMLPPTADLIIVPGRRMATTT